MAQAPTSRLPPWSQRILDGSPFSPFWTGALLALGFLLLFLVYELALGRFAEYEVDTYREDLRVAVVLCLFAAYLPAAWLYSVRSAQRTADELRPSLTRGDGTVGLEEAGRFDEDRNREDADRDRQHSIEERRLPTGEFRRADPARRVDDGDIRHTFSEKRIRAERFGTHVGE